MFIAEKSGLMDYQTALEYQNKLVYLRQNGLKTDYFLLLEHDHVFTTGKGANKENILDKNIPVITTNRGGDLTYHGPGQLIGYIILDLRQKNLDLHSYLRSIEQLIMETVKKLDIEAYQIPGLTGVWAENKKIASIGIGIKKGITMHGFALNVNTDLSYFSKINPCGLSSDNISSLGKIKNKKFNMEKIQDLFIEKFPVIFL